jgi:MbtH protein
VAEYDPILATHLVVVNDEDQHSVWPLDRALPAGWRAEGASGSEDQCLDHIERVWTDLLPRSARRRPAAGPLGGAA